MTRTASWLASNLQAHLAQFLADAALAPQTLAMSRPGIGGGGGGAAAGSVVGGGVGGEMVLKRYSRPELRPPSAVFTDTTSKTAEVAAAATELADAARGGSAPPGASAREFDSSEPDRRRAS